MLWRNTRILFTSFLEQPILKSRKIHGEAYRLSLERKARDLKIADNVVFHNRFVDLQELTEYISCCDIYLTPYLAKEQITSGTLAYAVGMGKAVVSTPYWHAEELLADSRGVLVDFRDVKGMAKALNDLIGDSVRRNRMRKAAYEYGRTMVWREVGRQYVEMFLDMLRERENLEVRSVLEAKDASSDYSPGDEARSFDLFVGRCWFVAACVLRYSGS